MNVSKYMEVGNEIKALGMKLQMILDPDADETQVLEELKGNSDVNKETSIYGIVIAGLILTLILGTFILLHFW